MGWEEVGRGVSWGRRSGRGVSWVEEVGCEVGWEEVGSGCELG